MKGQCGEKRCRQKIGEKLAPAKNLLAKFAAKLAKFAVTRARRKNCHGILFR